MQQRVADRYTLIREVGRGGMGAVWLARDEVLGRDVAVKRLAAREGLGPTEERVRREARLSAMLNHAGVVTVFDLADDGDDVWLVMEYVDSVTLSQFVREHGPLTPDHAASLVTQAAEALAVAHAAGIVHRDVKPGNMLVTPEGSLKLGDFGIARSGGDPSLTATGLVTGSPGYLAPEVAAGGTATRASDVWSLGASLFHTLVGGPPYDTGDNLMGTLYRLVHEEPPRTDRAGWLDPVLRGTMERDPQRRWTARQVCDFLAAGPHAVPPVIAPPTDGTTAARTDEAPERTQVVPAVGAGGGASNPSRSLLGGRRAMPAVALVVVLLVLFLGGGAWLLMRGDDPASEAGANSTPSATTSTPTTTPPLLPDEAGIEAFVGDYLGLVTSDKRAAFDMLTPDYQEESGGFSGYRSWWRQVKSVDLLQIDAQAQELTVSYRVRYDMKKGRDREENITLDLSFDEGDYLIAGQR